MRFLRTQKKRVRKVKPFDREAYRELNLSLENDYDSYQREQFLVKNYQRKVKRGKYNPVLAHKGFLNLIVTPYARKYNKEYGTRGMFGKRERAGVAKARLRYWNDRILGKED